MPRLTEFDPKWIDSDEGRRGLGFTMTCANRHCAGRMIVFFANPLDGGPAFEGSTWDAQRECTGIPLGDAARLLRGCGETRWTRQGDTFENLSLSPSVNMHECGHFTITNGGW